MAGTDKLDSVLQDTVNSIEQSKTEVYEILEETQYEYEKAQEELRQKQVEVKNIIKKVSILSKKERTARDELMKVSKELLKENEIAFYYRKADKIQQKLRVLKHREQLERQNREYLERTLQALNNTLAKAENLVTRLETVKSYLSNDIHSLYSELSDLKYMQQYGLTLLQMQEEERKRITRDIHDGPLQAFSSILTRIDYGIKQMEKTPEKAQKTFTNIKELIKNVLNDLREIIYGLRPTLIDDAGLIPALNSLIKQYNDNNKWVDINLNITGYTNHSLSTSEEMAIFRIIQEAVNNIIKHSRATEGEVTIEFAENKINIAIKDNGTGFNTETTQPKGATLGLKSMEERTKILGGNINIKSKRGEGTKILISIPFI